MGTPTGSVDVESTSSVSEDEARRLLAERVEVRRQELLGHSLAPARPLMPVVAAPLVPVVQSPETVVRGFLLVNPMVHVDP